MQHFDHLRVIFTQLCDSGPTLFERVVLDGKRGYTLVYKSTVQQSPQKVPSSSCGGIGGYPERNTVGVRTHRPTAKRLAVVFTAVEEPEPTLT
jgi:hypothetical protein